MEKYVSTLKNNILQNILEIEKMECSMLQKSKLIIPQLEEGFEQLKFFISNYSFKGDSEEIYFFKEIKPQLFCLLIYHSKVYNIEIRMPAGSIDDKKLYLEQIQNRIKYFFDVNLDFYQYYRSGSTHLDHVYFLRGKPDIQLPLDSFYFERDSNFSTCYDFKLTKILAHEMLTVYISNKLAKLTKEDNDMESIHGLHSNEMWTDKKNALGEIIYGIHTLASVNHGNIDIIVLASMFGTMFNVDLSNIYQIYIELKGRKERTEYLNRMITALKKRMDDDDSK